MTFQFIALQWHRLSFCTDPNKTALMQTTRLKTLHHFFTGLTALWLGACAAVSPTVTTTPEEATRAQQAQATGNFTVAATLWQEAAAEAVGPERHRYRLQAAEAWWQAGASIRTESQLKQVDEQQLISPELARFGLLHAELALAAANAQSAEFYLELARRNLTTSQQSRYRRLLERTRRLQTDPASYALASARSALKSGFPYDTTQGVAILQLLEEVSSGALQDMSAETASEFGLESWPELTVLIRQVLVNNGNLETAAADWARQHPAHPVTETGFSELARQYRQLFSLPRNIAVLLPVEGGLAAAGRAIRDGLVSAYLDRAGLDGAGPGNAEDVTLRFYPTTEDPQSAVSAYFQAKGEGAQWIIGPLRRESVKALSELGSLGLPALVLNNIVRSVPSQGSDDLLFSLSLSQEQEARSIARRALRNGKESAIMVTANNPWGQRMEAAFGEEFISGGGSIMANAQFEPSENDLSSLLTGLLQIDESYDRKNRVQATLGIALNFEPTRRDDFDLIFLAANPAQGRQIRPQLKFHEAGEVPVYAMSRIYNGTEDPTANQDINGVYFPSTRWQISTPAKPEVSNLSSLRDGNLASLHALGNDAWNLLPWLPLMRKDTDLHFPGAVGSLTMGQDGQLIRDPAWAQFSSGRPVPVEWPEQASQGRH
jgi:outer membrane PBP1 activator LpoA protein